jgi:hypothetical protein
MADGFDLLVPSPEVCMTFSSPTTPTGTESPSCHFQDSAVCVLYQKAYSARQPKLTRQQR